MANTIGLTHEAANAVATIIASQALGHLKANTVLARLVARDWDNEVATRGQTVRVIKRGALTVNDKAEHTEVTLQQPVPSYVDVTLNKHKEVSFLVEDPVRGLASPDFFNGYMEDGMKVLAEQIDADIAALYVGLSQTVNATGGLNEAHFRQARRLLNLAKAPMSDRFVVLHPYAEYEFLGIEEAKNSAYRETLGGALADAYETRFMGFRVFLDQKIVTAGGECKNLVFHRNALVLATRPLPRPMEGLGVIQRVMDEDGIGLRVTLSYDPKLLGMQCTIDVLYGVAEMLDAFGVCLRTVAA